MTLGQYAQWLTLGAYNGFNGPQSLLASDNDFEMRDSSVVNQADATYKVNLNFRVPEHEPLGPNEVFLHWIFYDARKVGNPNCTFNCFTFDNIKGPDEPLTYQNLLTFSDYYDLNSVVYMYAAISALSFFWVVGLPAQIILSFALTGYMFFMDVKNFLNAFKWGNRSAVQSLRLAVWWWFLESFLFWNVGT